MTRDVSPGQFNGEHFAGQTGKLGGLAKSKNLLLIKSHCQLAT